MGFDVKASEFVCDTITGPQSITGLGFQPKLILFLPSQLTVDGTIENAVFCFGAATDAAEVYASVESKDFVGTSDNNRKWGTTKCVQFNQPGSSVTLLGLSFTSMDADGFTFNVDANTGAIAYKIPFIAFGGTDLTDYEVGSFALETDSQQDVTLSGAFQPDAIMLASVFTTNLTDNNAEDAVLSVGFATPSSDYCYSMQSEDGQTTSDTDRFFAHDKCLAELNAAGTVVGYSSLNSMLSNGFRLDHTDNYAAADHVIYVAFKGIQIEAGNINTPTGTAPVDFSATGHSFQPTAIYTLSASGNAVVDTVTVNVRLWNGIASGPSNEYGVGMTDNNGKGTTETASIYDNDDVNQRVNNTGVVQGAANFKAFTSDGFTLTQNDTDATVANIMYLAFGPAAVSGVFTPYYYNKLLSNG